MKWLLITLCLFQGSSAVADEEKATLKVSVLDVLERPHGTVICALFEPGSGFPMDSSQAIKIIDATKGDKSYSCDFDTVVGKSYAVSVAHDENGNRKVDTNAFGVPQEGWATSNDVTHTFRAPNFEESKFQMKEPNQSINLHMHY